MSAGVPYSGVDMHETEGGQRQWSDKRQRYVALFHYTACQHRIYTKMVTLELSTCQAKAPEW